MVSGASIVGAGQAVPPAVEHMALWEGFFAGHYGNHPTAARVWRTAGIRTRHAVVDPRMEDVSRWVTGRRMTRYVAEGLPLAHAAARDALSAARLAPEELGLLAVASCTGYATPGIDVLLARDLGAARNVQRLLVGHMGCYAALPALGAAADFVAARGRPALLVCLELPSLHVQPPSDDPAQMVAHALFSDAAAGVVLAPDRPGLGLLDVTACTDVAASDHMSWDVTDLGFRIGLSPRVPDVLARHVAPAIADLLARHRLGVPDVAQWAVHPGGRRILEVVADQLALPPDSMRASCGVLRDYGNCSSATVLLVLDQVAGELQDGEYVVAMAFGPGLTLYAALLQRR